MTFPWKYSWPLWSLIWTLPVLQGQPQIRLVMNALMELTIYLAAISKSLPHSQNLTRAPGSELISTANFVRSSTHASSVPTKWWERELIPGAALVKGGLHVPFQGEPVGLWQAGLLDELDSFGPMCCLKLCRNEVEWTSREASGLVV